MLFPCAEIYGAGYAAHNRPHIVPGVAMTAWKQDSRAQRCGVCVKKFGLLRRKHHCRAVRGCNGSPTKLCIDLVDLLFLAL